MLEHQLNHAIGSALRLDFAQEVILTRNMQFRSKQKTFRTLVNNVPMLPESRDRFDKLAIKLGDVAKDRNMIAHDWFGPSDDTDGVQFMIARASGKLSFPKTNWSIKRFNEKTTELHNLAKDLKEVIPVFRKADIVKALLTRPPSNEELGELGPLGLALLQIPLDQGSPPPKTNGPIDHGFLEDE
jgi:hypothetical protein